MINLDAVKDYYIDSNELLVSVQRLRTSFEQVFELSLNTSLVTGKLQGEVADADVYAVVSEKVESIAKDLRRYIAEMIGASNSLTRCSLGNKQTTALLNKFEEALELVHGESNSASVKDAISRLEEGVEQSIKNAKDHAQHLADKLDSLNHLNEKIWLTLSQLKVQLAQGEDGQAER